jgi:hypothetical protein
VSVFFITNADPMTCAMAHDDKRLKRAVVRVVQVFCTAAYILADENNYPVRPKLYSPINRKDAWVQWLCKSHGNVAWFTRYGHALHAETLTRFSKSNISVDVYFRASALVWKFAPQGERTPFPSAMHGTDTITAHRWELQEAWRRDVSQNTPPTWTNSNPPDWRKAA